MDEHGHRRLRDRGRDRARRGRLRRDVRDADASRRIERPEVRRRDDRLDDGRREPDETFFLNLSNESSGTMVDPQAVVTITGGRHHRRHLYLHRFLRRHLAPPPPHAPGAHRRHRLLREIRRRALGVGNDAQPREDARIPRQATASAESGDSGQAGRSVIKESQGRIIRARGQGQPRRRQTLGETLAAPGTRWKLRVLLFGAVPTLVAAAIPVRVGVSLAEPRVQRRFESARPAPASSRPGARVHQQRLGRQYDVRDSSAADSRGMRRQASRLGRNSQRGYRQAIMTSARTPSRSERLRLLAAGYRRRHRRRA